MNALPHISHRLLVAAVADPYDARNSVVTRKKPVVIDCHDSRGALGPGVEETGTTLPAIVAQDFSPPALAGALWRF